MVLWEYSILNHLTMDYWKTMEEYILLDKMYFLVNLKSCHTRVLNWAIRENIRPVELAQYGISPNWASSTGRILSRIAQLRTLAWQLLRFTRKYTLSRRIYSSIVYSSNPLLGD